MPRTTLNAIKSKAADITGLLQHRKEQESYVQGASVVERSNAAQGVYNRDAGSAVYRAAYESAEFIDAYRRSDKSDPTTLGFRCFWHFDAQHGLLADESSTNSALAYLKRINDTRRYNALKQFIAMLSKMSIESTWMFSIIEGIDEAWSTPLQGVLRNHEIKIATHETVDLLVHTLHSLYRQAMFDVDRGCYVLPVNLRRFSMSIFVYDTRAFFKANRSNEDLKKFRLRTFDNDSIAQLHHTLFDLDQCEFAFDSGKHLFSALDNTTSDFATNNLSFTVRKVEMSDLTSHLSTDDIAALWGLSIKTVSVDNDAPEKANNPAEAEKRSRLRNAITQYTKTLEQKVKERFRSNPVAKSVNDAYVEYLQNDDWKTTVLNHAATVASQTLVDAALKKLTKLYLGNVYGYGADDVAAAIRSGNPLAAVFRQQSNESTTQSLSRGVNYKNLGNVNQ